MQAFAEDTVNKLINSADANNKSAEVLANASLFNADDIIFPDDSTDRPYTRYGYKISKMNFLIPENTVSEVIQRQNIFNLPNSPGYIEGLINIRGNIIPVMNIDKLVQSESTEKLTNILVLDKTDKKAAIALLISDLPISLELGEKVSVTNKYPAALQEFILDGFNQNNVDWIEFSPQDLFKKLADRDN